MRMPTPYFVGDAPIRSYYEEAYSMYIRVKVTAGAKHDQVQIIGPNRFEIHVKEPAEQNRANDKVRALIAKQFQVEVDKVRILNGHHHPVKLLAIREPSVLK